jgi:hypothetical protein
VQITGRALRRLIREVIVREMPVRAGDFESGRGAGRGSIGRGALGSPEGLEQAQVLFKNIDDDWFIVTLEDTEAPEATVESPQFEAWLAAQGAEGARVIVVADAPLEGDHDDLLWAIGHDVVGHGIWQLLNDHMPDELDPIAAGAMSAAIHKQLPEGLRLGGEGDVEPDILAGLFLGELDREAARDAAVAAGGDDPDAPEAADMLLSAFEATLEDWISRFEPGKPVLVRPFSDPPDK